ncbi:MAG: hypothetical protein ACJAYU_003610 [Bradymonadia bacterium]|jgi:hypothetical protein
MGGSAPPVESEYQWWALGEKEFSEVWQAQPVAWKVLSFALGEYLGHHTERPPELELLLKARDSSWDCVEVGALLETLMEPMVEAGWWKEAEFGALDLDRLVFFRHSSRELGHYYLVLFSLGGSNSQIGMLPIAVSNEFPIEEAMSAQQAQQFKLDVEISTNIAAQLLLRVLPLAELVEGTRELLSEPPCSR